MLELFWWLMVGHAFVDFGWQTAFVGKYKFRKYAKELPKEQKLNEVWIYNLLMHGLMHGGITAIVIQTFLVFQPIMGMMKLALLIGFSEFLLHSLIDFAKTEGKINLHEDQWAHFLCKFIWCFLIGLYVS